MLSGESKEDKGFLSSLSSNAHSYNTSGPKTPSALQGLRVFSTDKEPAPLFREVLMLLINESINKVLLRLAKNVQGTRNLRHALDKSDKETLYKLIKDFNESSHSSCVIRESHDLKVWPCFSMLISGFLFVGFLVRPFFNPELFLKNIYNFLVLVLISINVLPKINSKLISERFEPFFLYKIIIEVEDRTKASPLYTYLSFSFSRNPKTMQIDPNSIVMPAQRVIWYEQRQMERNALKIDAKVFRSFPEPSISTDIIPAPAWFPQSPVLDIPSGIGSDVSLEMTNRTEIMIHGLIEQAAISVNTIRSLIDEYNQLSSSAIVTTKKEMDIKIAVLGNLKVINEYLSFVLQIENGNARIDFYEARQEFFNNAFKKISSCSLLTKDIGISDQIIKAQTTIIEILKMIDCQSKIRAAAAALEDESNSDELLPPNDSYLPSRLARIRGKFRQQFLASPSAMSSLIDLSSDDGNTSCHFHVPEESSESSSDKSRAYSHFSLPRFRRC